MLLVPGQELFARPFAVKTQPVGQVGQGFWLLGQAVRLAIIHHLKVVFNRS